MSPAEVLRTAHKIGLEVSIAKSGNLFVTPTERLTDDMRVLLVTHKAEVIEFLREAHETMGELLATAMLVCDDWGDDEEARAEMRANCVGTAPHHCAELLEHFLQEYRGKLGRPGTEPQGSQDGDP